MKLNDPSLLRSKAYINGEWVDAVDGRVFGVHNPANGKLIIEVADLNADAVTLLMLLCQHKNLGPPHQPRPVP